MARLIVKSPYIKGGSGGGPGGYLKYIGTREGVELLPAGYMEYMAERPRSHGLFGDEDNVDMDAAMKELNEYPGNIWTHVISLKREDAERLGYDHAAQWRNLIRAHRNEIAAAMSIPSSDFRWYAAFHDEGDHPHIHMMAWSVKPGQAYFSKNGIRKIKSTLTNDVFKQEMLHTYEQKSISRDELVRRAREEMKALAQEMQTRLGSYPEMESLMMALAGQLETVTGKKKYGYLPKAVKKTVDEIVDRMEQELTDFSDLSYDCWELWMVTQDDTAPMADRDEAAARQGVVAAQYALGQLYLADDPEVRDTELGIQWLEYAAHHGSDRAAYQLGKEYLRGKVVARDVVKAMDYLTQSAETGNQYAQYTLGKLHLDRQEREQAHYWFTQSAAQGNEYAQFFLDRWDSLKSPSVMLSVSRLLHHMGRIFQEQAPAPSVPDGIQIDRKRLAQLREKKIAMGHKLDDHEEQAPSWTMTMG